MSLSGNFWLIRVSRSSIAGYRSFYCVIAETFLVCILMVQLGNPLEYNSCEFQSRSTVDEFLTFCQLEDSLAYGERPPLNPLSSQRFCMKVLSEIVNFIYDLVCLFRVD
jgi:hypothetical protein